MGKSSQAFRCSAITTIGHVGAARFGRPNSLIDSFFLNSSHLDEMASTTKSDSKPSPSATTEVGVQADLQPKSASDSVTPTVNPFADASESDNPFTDTAAVPTFPSKEQHKSPAPSIHEASFAAGEYRASFTVDSLGNIES